MPTPADVLQDQLDEVVLARREAERDRAQAQAVVRERGLRIAQLRADEHNLRMAVDPKHAH